MRGVAPRIVYVLLALSAAAALYLRLSAPGQIQARRTFPVLGTFATVIVTAPEPEIPFMFTSADSLLRHLDGELGRFSSTGALCSLNERHSAALDSRIGELILLSDSIVRGTGGCFDPSLGLLVELWGFPDAQSPPDSSQVEECLEHTGWEEMVVLTADSVFLRSGAALDLGAIAKGYAVDRTWELLMEMGATECLVEVGGEIRCGSLTGRTWHVGVRHPREDSLAGILSITGGAVATSGDYECFFMHRGIRYSHLLDRRTGFPSRNAAGSTVLADNCATADAMATAAAVAGPETAGTFSPELYTGMIIITEGTEGTCDVHQIGEVPWGR